jgi:hypothetical protein
MSRTRLVVSTLVVSAAVYATVALAGGRPLSTSMTGAQEAPGPGDPDGSGVATLAVNPGQQEVCVQISVSNIALPATGAHIHEAPVGEPGPVVVTLPPPDGTGFSSGCVTADREILAEIKKNPGEYYVNVHNADYPGGAVRGQLGN